jgi:hypothetical protein
VLAWIPRLSACRSGGLPTARRLVARTSYKGDLFAGVEPSARARAGTDAGRRRDPPFRGSPTLADAPPARAPRPAEPQRAGTRKRAGRRCALR